MVVTLIDGTILLCDDHNNSCGRGVHCGGFVVW